mmetsp:Transcript_16889/g.35454  ORF Transcript_16889/g.35454 Transcript_16889/m.35454 type:complete len:164 (+) Transcript_16889:250-741(+)
MVSASDPSAVSELWIWHVSNQRKLYKKKNFNWKVCIHNERRSSLSLIDLDAAEVAALVSDVWKSCKTANKGAVAFEEYEESTPLKCISFKCALFSIKRGGGKRIKPGAESKYIQDIHLDWSKRPNRVFADQPVYCIEMSDRKGKVSAEPFARLNHSDRCLRSQ